METEREREKTQKERGRDRDRDRDRDRERERGQRAVVMEKLHGLEPEASSEPVCHPVLVPVKSQAVMEEVRSQCFLAFPMIYASLAQYSIQIVSLMFSGHLDELSLSSASLATSFASVTGNSLLVGNSW